MNVFLVIVINDLPHLFLIPNVTDEERAVLELSHTPHRTRENMLDSIRAYNKVRCAVDPASHVDRPGVPFEWKSKHWSKHRVASNKPEEINGVHLIVYAQDQSW